MLKLSYTNNNIEAGIDEAGRGCLLGNVYAAAVIMPTEFSDDIYLQIRDSKKLSAKKRNFLKDYIESNAISYGIGYCTPLEIDTHNIREASLIAMHRALDKLNVDIDTILVDGNYFKPYFSNYDNFVNYICIAKGDNQYLSIASASILAKCYHDQHIINLINNNSNIIKYGLNTNMGYGTKIHLDAIKKYGITEFHRKTFSPCQI